MQLERIAGFEWDEGNATKNEHKHAVSQRESEQVFFNQPLWIVDDPVHSRQEVRAHAFGSTDDERLLHVTFTLRAEDTLIRVISARDMSIKERKWYASQNNT